MALKKPLVLGSGQNQQLQTADALDYFKAVSVAYATSLTLDADTGDIITVGALTANPTIDFIGTRARVIVRVTQDATGGRTITWGASVTYLAGVATIAINPAANGQTILTFLYNSTTVKYDIVASSYASTSAVFGQVTVDFGTANTDTVTVTASDTGVSSGSIIALSLGGVSGRDADELEMVSLDLALGAISAGVGFDIIVACQNADADGQYLVNYTRN